MRTRSILILLAILAMATGPTATRAELQDEVFYHFMPIAWRDSDQDALRFGDFGGMTASLDYLEGLGITAIWMNPIFPSPAYHGYQHGRADELNAWFGNEAQWRAFVQAAHARGIKVYVDFVAYGISHDSPWFADAYANPASPYDDWLAFEDSANTTYLGSAYTTWNGSTVGFIHWDLRNPHPVQLVTDWAVHWLDPDGDGNFDDGLDGFRLDHVWSTYPYGPDGWGYHIDDFWTPWRDALRVTNPAVRIFGEQANWGSYGTDLFPGMDAAFTKPFEFAARDALRNEIASPLYGSMAATVAAQQNASVPGTFLATIGNHDVGRLASEIGDDFEKAKAAAAVLLTQPYAPVIYYGDEIGMRGLKDPSLGGDASDIPMREPFKWNAVEGAPMSAYHAAHPAAWANRISRDNDGRSVEEQDGVAGSLLEAYRELVALRLAHPSLRSGDYHPVTNTHGAVWSFLRHHASEQSLVVINLSGQPATPLLDLESFPIPGGSTALVSRRGLPSPPPLDASNRAAYPISLSAYGYDVFDLQLDPPVVPFDEIDGRNLQGAVLATQNSPVLDGFDDYFELDRLQVRREGDRLVLSLAGNIGGADLGGLCVFYDAVPGGQNTLDVTGLGQPPSGPHNLSGLRFDLGFEPEGFLYLNQFQTTLYVDQMFLLSGGGATSTYRGSTVVGGGTPLLSGGTNATGMKAAVDNSNRGGVDFSSVADAPNVTTGVEIDVALADFGIDESATEISFSACLLYWTGDLSNQWLPGIGPGHEILGVGPDLRAFPGDQYLTIPIQGEPVGAPLPASTLSLRAFDGPGSSVLRFELPGTGEARLALYDLRGRRVREFEVAGLTVGSHELRWDGRDANGRDVAAGTYFARLSWRSQVAVARVLRLR